MLQKYYTEYKNDYWLWPEWAGLEGEPGRDLRLLNHGIASANQEQKVHGTISPRANLPLRITVLTPDWVLVSTMDELGQKSIEKQNSITAF